MRSIIASLRTLVLPWGAKSGPRTVLDGTTGRIEVYDSAGVRIALIDSTGIWAQASDGSYVRMYAAAGAPAALDAMPAPATYAPATIRTGTDPVSGQSSTMLRGPQGTITDTPAILYMTQYGRATVDADAFHVVANSATSVRMAGGQFRVRHDIPDDSGDRFRVDILTDPFGGPPICEIYRNTVVHGSVSSDGPMLQAGTRSDISTVNSAPVTTVEAVIQTVTNYVFKAGVAYRVTMFQPMLSDVAGRLAAFRLRKTNLAGADWGEYFRWEAKGNETMHASGERFLIRSASTDLTATVVLCAFADAGNVTMRGNIVGSPRYLLIEPCGLAAEYAGLGIDVT